MQFLPGQHIHCIGIGGYGISAIARSLLERGFPVSGSDRNRNALTEALARDGAMIYKGHAADHVQNADLVIATSAVGNEHIEVVAATERGIPVYRRRDILAPLMQGNTVIAVAGTHGKTTTTSMIVHILREYGKDPSYIVGGVLASTGTNARVGKDAIFVIEADEYDNMFLGLEPDIAVITSIEYDHPDFFKSEQDLLDSFGTFIELLRPNQGMLIACAEDIHANRLAKKEQEAKRCRVYTYGLRDGVDFQATHVRADDNGRTCFDWAAENSSGPASLLLPGVHNVLNALAAITVKIAVLGSPVSDALAALETFKSTARRFDVRDEVGGVVVIDDYAHHPTAIKATLEAARMRYPDHEIWAVWQPHMYSRTQQLMGKYMTAFGAADHVVVTDVFAAREDPIPGVNSAWAVSQIQHADVHHTPSLSDAVDLLAKQVESPAVIIIMSAGDAPQIGIDYIKMKQDETD